LPSFLVRGRLEQYEAPWMGARPNTFVALTSPAGALPADDELGALGVAHIVRMWARVVASRQGRDRPDWTVRDTLSDRVVLDGLGLGLEPTTTWLWQSGPTLEEFEQWILDQKGGALDSRRVGRVNALVLGEPYDTETRGWLAAIDAIPPVLGGADLELWNETGYLILHDAIDPGVAAAAEQAVWDYLGASVADQESWYPSRLNGIMVQLFEHDALERARRSSRIHKAFAQLWGTADLLATTDRCGFNPPERDGWHFPGPNLHLDVAPEPPVPFGVQGLIYLTDTTSDQGAFTCVPGFHHEIDHWLADDPLRQTGSPDALKGLAGRPIAGRAGDMVIWHHALPHGSSPNQADLPRIVQYLTLSPPYPDRPAASP
jgi:hypothetical protein